MFELKHILIIKYCHLFKHKTIFLEGTARLFLIKKFLFLESVFINL